MKLLLVLLFTVNLLFANVAIVSAFNGKAVLKRANENIDITIGLKIEKSDEITTFKYSKLQLIFKDKTVITIGQNSNFEIQEYFYDEKKKSKVQARFGFKKGIFRTISGRIGKINPNKFKIRANSATIGIRGTKFDVFVNDDYTKIGVLEGIVYHKIGQEILDINKGEVFTYNLNLKTTKIKEGVLEEKNDVKGGAYKKLEHKKDQNLYTKSFNVKQDESNNALKTLKDIQDEVLDKNEAIETNDVNLDGTYDGPLTTP